MEQAILLVEDSEVDERHFKSQLTKCGVLNPLAVARDGKQAINYLMGKGPFADRVKHPLPQILFLDLKMPKVDGFVVLQWLQNQRALRSKLLVIVLTHLSDVSNASQAHELGAHTFLVKPLKVADLRKLISAFDGRWMLADGKK